MTMPSRTPSTLIQLTRVSKVYGSGDAAVHALRDVDLGIHTGDFAAVMGISANLKH